MADSRGVKRDSLRLEYLDGLRAGAALYVVLFHAGVGFTNAAALPRLARAAQRALTFGHHAVAVFIVLSGYCLMLPAARGGGRLTRSFSSYIGRRAWRILPPYYAVLFGTLVLMKLVPALASSSGTIWDDSSPAFEFGPIATHVLVIHNLFPAWIYRINGPLWSVATEWQIYFSLPLVLLPVWRRFRSAATLAVAFGLGCLPIWLAPAVAERWIPWYLGLFALGVCAAGIGFSERASERSLARLPWGVLALGLLGVCLLGATVFVRLWFRHMPWSDTLVGCATAASLVYCTSRALDASRPRPRYLRVLESAPAVWLGRFSYSLYLIHLPVVAACYFALRPLRLSPGLETCALLALGVPASLLVAYAFYLAIERHFIGAPHMPWAARAPAVTPALLGGELAHGLGGDAGDERVRGNVARDDGACGDHRTGSDRDPG